MQSRIDDETIEAVAVLAKLELTGREKELAKEDMERMLCYIDQMGELDTEEAEPVSHIFPMYNVFREDAVTNGDSSKEILQNAPDVKNGCFKVPRTVE